MNKRNRKITWLWLEDEPNSVNDIEMKFRQQNISYIKLQNYNDLFNKLVSIKNESKLKNYGLIIDIMIWGTPIIVTPHEWHDNPDKKHIYHHATPKYSGVVFYEKVILEDGKAFWFPPPPVLFLSSMYPDDELEHRIKNIKIKYAANLNDGSSPEDAKIKFVRKWEFDCEVFNDITIE